MSEIKHSLSKYIIVLSIEQIFIVQFVYLIFCKLLISNIVEMEDLKAQLEEILRQLDTERMASSDILKKLEEQSERCNVRQ